MEHFQSALDALQHTLNAQLIEAYENGLKAGAEASAGELAVQHGNRLREVVAEAYRRGYENCRDQVRQMTIEIEESNDAWTGSFSIEVSFSHNVEVEDYIDLDDTAEISDAELRDLLEDLEMTAPKTENDSQPQNI